MGSNIIYNKEKLKRIISFQGLPFVGTKSPTDIDFCLEDGDRKKYMIGDFKEKGKLLTNGQKILLERHCLAFEKLGYKTLAVLAWHETHFDTIEACECIIATHFYNGEWVKHQRHQTFYEWYCRFFNVN